MKLTPLKVDMLMQLHWNPEFVPDTSMAAEAALNEFFANGLIQYVDNKPKLDERGKVFISMILDTPLPVRAAMWVDPRKEGLIK